MKRSLYLGLAALGLIALSLACASSGNPSAGGGGSTPEPQEKRLSAFSPVTGTDFMIATISSNPPADSRSINPFDWINSSGYGFSGYVTYNYVFFDINQETFVRVLPTNNYVVWQLSGFPYKVNNDPTEADKVIPVQWWMYIVIKADTNQDKLFDYRDKLTIGFSDVSGKNYVELLDNVSSVLGFVMKGDQTLFLFYNADNKNYTAKIDLPSRVILQTTEMQLGDDVK